MPYLVGLSSVVSEEEGVKSLIFYLCSVTSHVVILCGRTCGTRVRYNQ